MNVRNRVLLIEDDPPLRRSLENYLERAGYTFESCADARTALTLAEGTRFDAVILEYLLPDSDCAALLQKLIPFLPDSGAILLSEYDFEAVAENLSQAPVGTFLKKPFDLSDLEFALSCTRSKSGIPSVKIEPELTPVKGMPAVYFK